MQTYLKRVSYLPIEIERLKRYFKGTILFDAPLSKLTSFGVGGHADILAYPKDIEDVATIVEFSRDEGIPLTVLGRGTNLLIRDGGIGGIVVSLRDGLNSFELTEETIVVGAGMPLPYLSKLAMDNGISGFEFAWGIPGSVGGAVVMNAGAFGGNISEHLEEVLVVDTEGKVKRYFPDQMDFSYRTSIFRRQSEEIIVSVKFRIDSRAPSIKIREKMMEYERIRKNTQPIGAKTAGSIFKNPRGDYAGRLIEKVGLKGMRIGDAMVSMVHANFIENIGNARAKDIEALIIYVEEKVRNETGISLAREVEILGYVD